MDLRAEVSAPEWLREAGLRSGAFEVREIRHSRDALCDWVGTLLPASGGAPVRVLIEAKSRLTARAAVAWLNRLVRTPHAGVPLLCSERVSPRVAELCLARGAGYLDAAGNCRIEAPGFFVHVEGRAGARRAPPVNADPFAPKSSRVTRLLLSDPSRGWHVKELAEEAGISMGLASRVKRALVEDAHAETRDGRVYPTNPRELLAAWVASYSVPADERAFYVMGKAPSITRQLASWCEEQGVQYALSGFSGAWIAAPMVRHPVTVVYVDAVHAAMPGGDLRDALGAQEVDSGANLRILRPWDGFVFHGSREIEGVCVASPLQLYLDLMRAGGRGEEAALEVLQKEILPAWRT